MRIRNINQGEENLRSTQNNYLIKKKSSWKLLARCSILQDCTDCSADLATIPVTPQDEPSDPPVSGMLHKLSPTLTILLALPCNVQPWQPSSPFSSSSRQIQVTTGGSIRGDLLLALPLSFLLSTIGFNTDFKRRNGRVRKFETKDDRTDDWSSPLLSRIDFLFQILDMDDEDCKQRAICEIVQNKLIYSPLSELLISIFRKSRRNFLEVDVNSSVEWDRYFYSSFIGQNSKDENICEKTFSKCPLKANQLVNIPVLKLWQLAANKISIRIDDE